MTAPPLNSSRPGSDAYLAALVSSSTDGIISKDLNSIITTWNRGAERIFGYTADEAVGRPITILFPPDRLSEELTIIDRIKRGEIIEHFETVRRHKDGSLLDVAVTISPIREDGRIIGASKIVRDIREQKRAQERMHVTLASIGDAVIATDVHGGIVFMNPVAEQLTGWSEAEALGRPLGAVFKIINEESRQPVESPVDKVIREGTVAGLANHTLLVAKDGTETPIDDSAAPIRESASGELMGVVLVFRNVAERRAAQLAALRLAAIVEGSDDAIVGKNLRGVVTSWNRGAERIFGYTADEMIGQPITLLIPLDRLSEEEEILSRLQRGERVQHFETVRVRKDGREINVSLTISPIRDPDGVIIGASKIARDVTAQKDAERALQQAQRQLKVHAQNLEREVRQRTARLHEMVAELDAFSYSLSHDLRAPLRAIQGFSEIVLTEHGEKIPEGAEYLRRILKAVGRMDRLIQDVLAFSRMSRAEMTVRHVDLEKLIAAVIHDRPQLQPPKANVTIEHPVLPVLGHEASLVQVIANLLDNAVKFVRNGVVPDVRVATRVEGDNVRLLVTDNGIGIDPVMHPRLFRMFERLPTTEPYEGTGVGLAIVRKAAERMNGRAGVESKPGVGSTFWIELPRAPAD